MDGMDAVIDAPEVEEIDAIEPDQGESGLEPAEPVIDPNAEPSKDDPYTTKFSREYRAALKALETAHPEQAKYLKQARDNHARLFALTQLEPKGIDGVRERYAMLDSLALGDAKGSEALTAMQERLQQSDEVDAKFMAGDPSALDALGEDFNAGLGKIAPAFLQRIQKSDPAAYEAAIMPHVVTTLKGSEALTHFNSLIDVLNTTDDPRLDDKAKMTYTINALGKMSAAFNNLAEKGVAPPVQQQPDKLQEERTAFEKERQEHHWKTQIQPQAIQHENAKFDELFKPYNLRLKLDAGATEDLKQSFKAALTKAGNADQDYLRQMKIYRAQKNPDPTAVTNFVKNSINKHSKTVMESLIKARYSPFLNGKPKPAAVAAPGNQPPPAPNVEIRTVKPPMSEIDHRNTPVDWLAKKQYRLYSGKVIQVRA